MLTKHRPLYNKKFYQRLFFITGILLTLGGLIYSIINYVFNSDPTDIPFIAADHTQPIKVKPSQNLNPRLPHADKLIYHELDNQNAMLPLEQTILELPEQPEPYLQETVPAPLQNSDILTEGASY